MTDFVGLTQGGALGQGGQNLGTEAQGLLGQLRALVGDMEKDGDAIQGSALAEFRRAQKELFDRFGELTGWCDRHGVKLGEGQGQVGRTDLASEQEFGSAGGGLAGLAHPINV